MGMRGKTKVKARRATEEVLMIKRVVFGIVWFLVLYIGACGLTGGIAGGIAANKNPDNVQAASAKAGAEAVLALRGYFLVGAVILAGVGAWTGTLPGTATKRTR